MSRRKHSRKKHRGGNGKGAGKSWNGAGKPSHGAGKPDNVAGGSGNDLGTSGNDTGGAVPQRDAATPAVGSPRPQKKSSGKSLLMLQPMRKHPYETPDQFANRMMKQLAKAWGEREKELGIGPHSKK